MNDGAVNDVSKIRTKFRSRPGKCEVGLLDLVGICPVNLGTVRVVYGRFHAKVLNLGRVGRMRNRHSYQSNVR
ncbi:unannotated protein [freshwater metagenome]|uniref:Unannotated protein n=1 Tax=freshwater metagenome TaxID=449393 RepID=A0A6J7DTN8_9ZZZZ